MGDLNELAAIVKSRTRVGHCAGCGYALRDLPEPRCPECGRAFDPLNPRTMNMSGKSYGPIARFLLAPPVWPLLIAAAATFLCHMWLARIPWRGDNDFSPIRWAWSAIALLTLLCIILRWWTVNRLRPPPDLLGHGFRRLWAVPILLSVSFWLASTLVPFRVAFWLSRPSMDTLVEEITSAPLRHQYPDRSVGLFRATDIYATLHEAGFRIPDTQRYLVCKRGPDVMIIGMARTEGPRLSNDWRVMRDDYGSREALLSHVLRQLATQPEQAAAQVPFLAESLVRPPTSSWVIDGCYDSPLRPLPDGNPLAGIAAELQAQPLGQDSSNDKLLRADLRAMVLAGPAAVPALRQLMGDAQPWPRLLGAVVAMEMGIDAAPLRVDLVALLSDSDGDVRAFAAAALGHIGPDAHPATPALLFALRDGDPDVRLNAAYALRRISPSPRDYPQLLPHMLASLASSPADGSHPAGVLATLAWWRNGGTRMAQQLHDGKVRQLKAILIPPPFSPPPMPAKKVQGKPELSPQQVEQLLEKSMDTIERHITQRDRRHSSKGSGEVDNALRELRSLGERAAPAVSTLIWLAEADEHYLLDGDVYLVLKAIGPAARPATPLLLRAMQHPIDHNWPVEPAAEAFVRIAREQPELARQLVAVWPKVPPRHRGYVRSALPQLGPAAVEVMPLLPEMLAGDQRARQDAYRIIRQIGPPAAPLVPDMLAAINRNGSMGGDRAELALALQAVGPGHPAVVPALIDLLDEWGEDRATAAQVLGAFGPAAAAALPVLEQHARFDLDWRIRAVCRDAVAKIRVAPATAPASSPDAGGAGLPR